MNHRLLTVICCLLTAVCCLSPLSARVRTLPVDSIALPTQMILAPDSLPELQGLVRYDRGRVWLTRLVDCYARIPLRRGVVLTLDVVDEGQQTADDRQYKIRFGGFRGELPLTLYVPLADGQSVFVNGHDYPETPRRDGYLRLSRTWRSGHEVLIR